MVTVSDVAELRRRMKHPSDITITRMKGCYVSDDYQVLARIDEKFLNLDSTEFYKYLDIARAPFQSKKIDDNIVTLKFSEGEWIKRLLQNLIESNLEDSESEDELYQEIINNYGCVGNYLILLFADNYDVMKRTKDNNDLDESEEVYSYISCVICSVVLEKEGLQYDSTKEIFRALDRQRIIGAPEHAFVYPAFDHRSADRDEIMYYCKNAAKPSHTLTEDVLGCFPFDTATEKREKFEDVIYYGCGENVDYKQQYIENINAEIEKMILQDDPEQPTRLTPEMFEELIKRADVAENFHKGLLSKYKIAFSRVVDGKSEWPKLANLYDHKKRDIFYAKQHKQKGLELLRQASRQLSKNGDFELQGEIDTYVERTRL